MGPAVPSQDACPRLFLLFIYLFRFPSSGVEMAIDWENQRGLKLLVKLKILWNVLLLTWRGRCFSGRTCLLMAALRNVVA